jgi:hypothetical protein
MGVRAATNPNWWLFVRFEQGRGRGGVPKTYIPYLPEGAIAPTIETLTRMAVQMMRAQCADPSMHGRDLMPGRDDEYHLHNIDGGLLTKPEDIRWEIVAGDPPRGQVAEVVLTWRIPNEDLITNNSVSSN